MIFVVGGSGGGFSTKDAIIHANAPLGSTVSFLKDNVPIKVIEPTKAIANSDGETADYYYSIKNTSYGSWTVTASLDGDVASETVVVSAVKQYNIELSYHLWLIKNGDECTLVTGGWQPGRAPVGGSQNYPIVSQYSDRINLHYNSSGSYDTVNKIDLTDIQILKLDVFPTASRTNEIYFCLRSEINNNNSYVVLNKKCSLTMNQRETFTLDVASVSGSYYVTLYVWADGSDTFIGDIYRVWGEKQ